MRTKQGPAMDTGSLEKVHDLVDVNIDSTKGFSEAAECVKDASLAGVFRDMAAERRVQADELRRFLVTCGESTKDDDGTVLAAAHRKWIDMRSALNSGDAYVILVEAERGEDHIKNLYEKILDDPQACGTPELRELLLRHYDHVKADHDRIRALRDARKKS